MDNIVKQFLLDNARKGGNATLKKRGKAHYQKMNKLSQKAKKARRKKLIVDNSK